MKYHSTIVITTFFILIYGQILSQPYTPFPDSNAVWSVCFRTSTHFHTKHYQLEGDTNITTHLYSKLYYNDGLNDSIMDLQSPNTAYYGAIRQDTIQRKVFFIPADTSISIDEFVLYDFSLVAGDSIKIPLIQNFSITGFCTDTVFVSIGGVSRKSILIYFPILNNSTQWLEGIGDIAGFFGYQNQTSTVLLCQSVNDSIIFKYNSPWNWYYSPPFSDSIIFQSCSYHDTLDSLTNNDYLNIESDVISLYPNPLTNSSLIIIPENIQLNNFNLEIFDLHGKKIKTFHNLNNRQLTLSRADFKSKGIYFLQIKSDNYFETIKLLVQ